MECIMIHAETRGRQFAAVLTFAVLLFTVSPTHGQYMSLSEGDTFIYKGLCALWYSNPPDTPIAPNQPSDTIRFEMIVDSVRYCEDRKNVFLSLLNHQDDYFFGSGNQGLLNDYNLSIRFIEGIGPTYGLIDIWCVFRNLYNVNHGFPNVYYHYFGSQLGLLQCMYKDDSLVYMVNENLGCDQSCFGYQEVGLQQYPQSYLNVYPNPASQYVVLDMSTGEEMDGSIVITDMLGRLSQFKRQKGPNARLRYRICPLECIS